MNGAKWGAILTPGNIILALCGKKKASLIMTAIGSGLGRGKTLLEASKNFASQWLVDEKKIDDPGIKRVAGVHNRIIQEFLKL